MESVCWLTKNAARPSLLGPSAVAVVFTLGQAAFMRLMLLWDLCTLASVS